MIIKSPADKDEFLRLVEGLHEADQPYVTQRDLGNSHLFEQEWVSVLTTAYPDLLRSEAYRPPTGGRTSTRIALACAYEEALEKVGRFHCNGNGNAAIEPLEDKLSTVIWERCLLIVGLARARNGARLEHVLDFALQYYSIVNRAPALFAID